MYCFFDSSCTESIHIAFCFIIVIVGLILGVAFLYFLGWCIGCAIHTGICNDIAMSNEDKIRDLTARIAALENKSKKEVSTNRLLR